MPSLTVRNVPENVYKLLHDSAHRHNRSLNQEIISILAFEADLARRGLELVRDFPAPHRLGEDSRRHVKRLPRSARREQGNRQR